MTIAEWSILGAVLIYLLTNAPLKPIAGNEFDNHRPRSPDFYGTPLRQRILGAHQNGIETFPFFAAAVLLAEFRGAPQAWIDISSIAFLGARLAFIAAYLADRPTLRTALWNIGFGLNLGIFLMAGFGLRGAWAGFALGIAMATITSAILAADVKNR